MNVPTKRVMEKTYAEMAKTPEAALESLEVLRNSYVDYRLKFRGAGFDSMPYFCKNTLQVPDAENRPKGYSQVDHIRALEKGSADWDLESANVDVLIELEEKVKKLASMDKTFDFSHAIEGFGRLQQITAEAQAQGSPANLKAMMEGASEAANGQANVDSRSKYSIEK
jgi:hypothetical protein